MKKISYYLLFILFLFSSCEGFLDVSNELADEKDMEDIFNSPVDTKKWYANVFIGIPDPSNMLASANGLDYPWASLADEIDIQGQANDWNFELYAGNHGRHRRWDLLWPRIRQANIFLENAHEIQKVGEAEYLSQTDIDEMKAEVRFLRAYYHYLLFEMYGPIPIVTDIADPDDKSLDYARNSIDEVVQFIYTELTETLSNLRDPKLSDTDRLAIPTKGTALALRAKLMIFAASPLFNGGFEEGLKLTNNDGKKLFPEHNPQKWQAALDAIQAFIDYANEGHYELYKEYDNNGDIDPHKSIYELHNNFNKESIFAYSMANWGNVTSNSGLDGIVLPRGVRGGKISTGKVSVLQELIDDFFMIDGLSIKESPLYSETGLTADASEDLSGQTEAGTFRMYTNREPRFYQTVFFNGRKWHVGNEQIWFNKGGNSDNSAANYPKAGTVLYKRVHKRVYSTGTHPRSMYRPGIIFRLAEFYLLYAEALNEVNPSDGRIIEYIDKVRERAGIPLLVNIKPQIAGNQAEQRKAIRAEMRVELATEGQRYFDVRRWMIAENPMGEGGQGGIVHGMDMNAETLDGFYKRTGFEDRKFNRGMYLYPLPINEIQNSYLLVQNPI